MLLKFEQKEQGIQGVNKIFARQHGAWVVEAYLSVPKQGRMPPVSGFIGVPATFEQAGFAECKPPSDSKVIMRYNLDADKSTRGMPRSR